MVTASLAGFRKSTLTGVQLNVGGKTRLNVSPADSVWFEVCVLGMLDSGELATEAQRHREGRVEGTKIAQMDAD
jgi:hypothetical protein